MASTWRDPLFDVMLPRTRGGGVATEPGVWGTKRWALDYIMDGLKGKGTSVSAHLLHRALLLNLALSQFLQQDQLSLLDSQFFLQLLDGVLPFLRRTLLHSQEKSHHPLSELPHPKNESKTSGNNKKTKVFSVVVWFPTMSVSVSVFMRQWPFIRGLDGSLSDSTITSSGDGGCRSFLMRLETKENNYVPCTGAETNQCINQSATTHSPAVSL